MCAMSMQSIEVPSAFTSGQQINKLQTRMQHRRLGGGGERKEMGVGSLMVRCAFGPRKSLKGKRHALHIPVNPISALISALTAEDTNVHAALTYHSKSMVLADWFTLFEEIGKQDRWLLTLEVFRWMQQQKWYRPDDGFYAKIISILGKKNQLRLAIWLFQQMKKHGCRPDSSVFNSLINAYLRTNDRELALVKAFSYYEQMKKMPRCQPNLVTYNMLLRACAQTKKTEKIGDLFKAMELAGFRPDIYTFNGMLDAYGKAGEFLEMDLMLKKMRQSKVQPDCITFNTLIDAYGKAGDMVKMEEALRSMASAHVEPQVSTFNALINNYGNAKRMEDMELVFKSMPTLGVHPTLITYEILMKGYGNCGRFDKMQSCFVAIHDAGFQAGNTTLNAVLDVYCSHSLMDEAEKFLDKARYMGLEPTHASYFILHKGYSKLSHMDKVEDLLKRMQAAGIDPNDKFFQQSLESNALGSSELRSMRKRVPRSRDDPKKARGSRGIDSGEASNSGTRTRDLQSSRAGSGSGTDDCSRSAGGSRSRTDDSSRTAAGLPTSRKEKDHVGPVPVDLVLA